MTHPWRIGSNLSGLIDLPTLEELLVLLDVQVIRTREISPTGELEGQFGVIQCGEDIRNDGILIDVNAQNLTLLVNTDDTMRSLMFCSNEDGLSGNSVHVNACTRFKVIEVNESVFRDQVNDSVLFRDLHRDGEIVGRLWREVDVDLLFSEGGIRGLMVDLYNVKLKGADHQ